MPAMRGTMRTWTHPRNHRAWWMPGPATRATRRILRAGGKPLLRSGRSDVAEAESCGRRRPPRATQGRVHEDESTSARNASEDWGCRGIGRVVGSPADLAREAGIRPVVSLGAGPFSCAHTASISPHRAPFTVRPTRCACTRVDITSGIGVRIGHDDDTTLCRASRVGNGVPIGLIGRSHHPVARATDEAELESRLTPGHLAPRRRRRAAARGRS